MIFLIASFLCSLSFAKEALAFDCFSSDHFFIGVFSREYSFVSFSLKQNSLMLESLFSILL
jgi:hypothetical protein